MGRGQVVKAPVFGIGIRRFESSRPSQFFAALILRFGVVFLCNMLRKLSEKSGFGETLFILIINSLKITAKGQRSQQVQTHQ